MTADLRFSLLGPLTAARTGASLPVGTPQQQAMLAVLLLRSGQVAAAGDLVDALWEADPPEAAITTVRTYAWRWRRVLEPDRSAPGVLLSYGDGYRLCPDSHTLDVDEAVGLAAQADRARGEGNPEEASDLFVQALGLWRGEALAGLPGPFAQRHRHRLSELRFDLQESRLELELSLGRHRPAVSGLQELVAEQPYRERGHLLLMAALSRSGRVSEALAVYRQLRKRLVTDLGVEPQPEIRVLHQRILDGGLPTTPVGRAGAPARDDREPDGGRAGEDSGTVTQAGPTAAALPRPAQLPPDITDFSGRVDQLRVLVAALTNTERRAPAVVSIVGMGGIGKTTLALRSAHEVRDHFPDGHLYADLRGQGEATEPAALLADFLTALGVPEQSIPAGEEARCALYRSVSHERRLLIVLDNARDAAQVRALLPGSAAGCAVLLASRVRLVGVPTDALVDLQVFSSAEALAVIRGAVGDARLEAEKGQAAALVAACGHLPLAVRIVAARLAARPSWTIGALAARLADERRRLQELRVGDLAVEAAFELGYWQLSADQADAFRTLATLGLPDLALSSAAAALGTDPRRAETLLESLVDVAMVESSGQDRYRYHDLLRVFAQQCARQAGVPEDLVRARLLRFYAATARRAFALAVPEDPLGDDPLGEDPLGDEPLGEDASGDDPRADRPTPSSGLPLDSVAAAREWTAGELDSVVTLVCRMAAESVHAANGCAVLTELVDLLVALSPFGLDRHYERLAPVLRLVARADAGHRGCRVEGRAWFLIGNLALAVVRLTEARSATADAIRACRESGDEVILRQALNDRGLVAQFLHEFAEAAECFDESIALAKQLGHRSGEMASALNAALALARSGSPRAALERCRAFVEAAPAGAGNTTFAPYVLGVCLQGLRRHEEALRQLARCLPAEGTFPARSREIHARCRMAESLCALGRPEEALREAELALAACQDGATERDRGYTLAALGRALTELDRPGAARARLLQAHEVFTRLGLPEAEEVGQLLGA